MSVAEAKKQAQTKLAECEATLAKAKAHVARHKAASAEHTAEFRAIEQAVKQHQIEAALGDSNVLAAPDTSGLERLRITIDADVHVARELTARVAAAEQAVKEARLHARQALSIYVDHTEVSAAQDELDEAFVAMHHACARLMAAHYIAHHELNDSKYITSPYDPYGPAAHFLASLQRLQWESYPYSVRPKWIPENGTWWPDHISGCHEHQMRIRAELEEEEPT